MQLQPHILEDDNEWYMVRMICMNETYHDNSHRMLNPFVTILQFCQPAHPVQLFNAFKQYLSEDFKLRKESGKASEKRLLMRM